MLHLKAVRISLLALGVTVLATAGASAEPAVGAQVQGEIKNVDLSGTPRHIVVQRPDGTGEAVRVRVHASTLILFESDSGGLPAEIGSLQPGMRVRVRYTGDKPAERIHVIFVPDAVREQERLGVGASGSLALGEVAHKVRLLEIDERSGEFKADLGGKTRTFKAQNAGMLARFDKGDMVIITVDENADGDRSGNIFERLRERAIVTDIRSADLFGRVIDVNAASSQIRVQVDGSEQTFRVERSDLARLRTGDHIRFEVEDKIAFLVIAAMPQPPSA
jgi:hypothetical protein